MKAAAIRRWISAAATAVRFAWILIALARIAGAEPPKHFVLELDIAIERGGLTGVLFDFGDGIWGENSSVAHVAPGPTPQTIRLILPAKPIRTLRFDPTMDDTPTLITGMRLLTDTGRQLLQIDPRTLRPLHQIQEIVPEGQGVRIRPTAGANDPMLRLDLPPLQKTMHDASGRATVNAAAVVALGIGLGMLVLTGVLAAGLSQGPKWVWVAGAAVFCAVFGARLFWLNAYSRAVPFWDEWEGDVLYMLIPFVGGFLDWPALFMPQWEHRIFLTRVITLFGTVLNGEWDPRVAMTVSAAIFSATVALIGMVLLACRKWATVVATAALLVIAALPYDFNNVFWGGQSQMYGLVLMAVVTLSLAAVPKITPWVYWGAAAGGAVSLGTMGAGLVGPGCAVGICLVRSWFEPAMRRSWLKLGAIFFTAAFLGLCWHVRSRAHVPLYATTFAQFQNAFIGAVAWPLPPRIGWVLLIWVPWIWHAYQVWRRREATSLEWLAIGLGVWALVNAIALGYARQYSGPPFDSRFFTSLSIGALGPLCSSLALMQRMAFTRWGWAPMVSAAAVVIGFLLVGINNLDDARNSWEERADIDQRIRRFLATGDRTPVLERPPHHAGHDVADRLEVPLFQQVLPAPYRRVLIARAAGDSPLKGDAGPVTLTVRTLMKIGPVIAVLGWIGLGFVIWRVRPTPEVRMPPPSPPVRERVRSKVRLTGETAFYALAALIVVGWFFVYNPMRRDGLVDEPGHLGAVYHFLGDQPGWPGGMPMLPGYHFVIVSLWKLGLPFELLTLARMVTTGFALLGLAAFALAWRELHGRPAGRATLLLALFPLAQPFTGLMYSDIPGLALTLCALWAQVSGRTFVALLALIGAIAIRQTNLAWVGFFLVWEFMRPDRPRRDFLQRTVWLWVLSAASGALLLLAGRLTPGTQHASSLQFNPATVHFAALGVLILGLPVWIARAPRVWGHWRDWARQHHALAGVAGVAGALVAIGCAVGFSNPHIFNRELFWEGCSFTLVRNWPLVWIDFHPGLKVLSGLNIVLMAAMLGTVIAHQPRRLDLCLVLAFGALPAVANGLVEPRYLIPGAGFLLAFLPIENPDWRRLASWWAAISAIHAPLVAQALSLW